MLECQTEESRRIFGLREKAMPKSKKFNVSLKYNDIYACSDSCIKRQGDPHEIELIIKEKHCLNKTVSSVHWDEFYRLLQIPGLKVCDELHFNRINNGYHADEITLDELEGRSFGLFDEDCYEWFYNDQYEKCTYLTNDYFVKGNSYRGRAEVYLGQQITYLEIDGEVIIDKPLKNYNFNTPKRFYLYVQKRQQPTLATEEMFIKEEK